MIQMLAEDALQIADDWVELCRWDPSLPPDNRPHDPTAIVSAIVEAILAGITSPAEIDQALADVAEGFFRLRNVDVGIGQVVCLRVAFLGHLKRLLPGDGEAVLDHMERIALMLDGVMRQGAMKAAGELIAQATIDELTGCPNRISFGTDLRRRVAYATRSQSKFTLVIIDMDHLKQVNDTYGHARGAEEIKRLASALQSIEGEASRVYRYGGDEFLVLFDEEPDVNWIMESLLEDGAPQFSWGSAVFPLDSNDIDEVTRIADRRLYGQRDAARGTQCDASLGCQCFQHRLESTVFAAQTTGPREPGVLWTRTQ